jgi:RNA polymerase sigma-70 factor (ECF subfamily)
MNTEPGTSLVAGRARTRSVRKTDVDVLVRASHGDSTAFAELVDSRVESLFRVACAILGNEADARDATQDAFVSAWQNLPRLRDTDRFDAWLHRVLVNRCRDMLRRRGRVRQLSLEAAGDAIQLRAPDPDDMDRVNAAFERLSAQDRQILVLHHLQEMPVSDIARLLRIAVGTAKWRLFRARRALERRLEIDR